MGNSKEQIIKYLNEFCVSSNPTFAILLSAPWGSGKSHLISEFINNHTDKEDEPLYISLYGVSNSADIDAAIVRAKLPALESDAGKFFTGMVQSIKSIRYNGVGIDTNKIPFADFLKTKLPKILIFDDLERSSMSTSDILGYINQFVEHQGKNVIIVANESELWEENTAKEGKSTDGKTKNVKRIKEKVIGRTITYQPDTIKIITSVIAGLSDTDIKKFFTKNLETIAWIFEKSECMNFRVLKQSLWDFERVFAHIDRKYKEYHESFTDMFSLFLALSLEFKTGFLEPTDLELRGAYFHTSSKDTDTKFEKLLKLQKKYNFDGFTNAQYGTALPVKMAIAIICDGVLDSKLFSSELETSSHFITPAEEQDWQTVWWAYHREECDVERAVCRMVSNFENLKYTDPGIILHVLYNKFQLADMKYEKKTKKQVVKEGKAYIDQLLLKKSLKQYNPKADWHNGDPYGYSDHGYMNMGFPKSNSPYGKEFQELYVYMQNKQMDAFKDSFEGIGGDLINDMAENIDRFKKTLSQTSSGGSYLAQHPVLASISPKCFVEKFSALPPKDQRKILETFQERYRHPFFSNLVDERKWLEDVIEKIKALANKSSKFKKWQLTRMMAQYLGSTIDNWNDYDNDAKGK